MSICPHCGMSNSDINKWCERCGYELIVEDRGEENTVERPTTIEKNTKTSGFVGSMGKTHYVSGSTSDEARDVQKHVSGFGLLGKMGTTTYEPVHISEDKEPENTDHPSRLIGTIGKTKYVPEKTASSGGRHHKDTKLYGSIGDVEYRGTHSESIPTPKVNTTSGLIGSIGESKFTTPITNESECKDKRVIAGAGIIGNVGDKHYKTDIEQGTPSSRTLTPPGRRKRIITVCAVFAVLAIAIIAVLALLPSATEFEDAINRRIENDMVLISDLPLEYQYSNAILRSISYNIVKSDRNSNTAIVQFRFVNIMALADQLGNKAIDQDEYYKYCIDAINTGIAPFTSKTIQVRFVERQISGTRQLCVVDNLEFVDVLSGGTVSAFVAIMEGN